MAAAGPPPGPGGAAGGAGAAGGGGAPGPGGVAGTTWTAPGGSIYNQMLHSAEVWARAKVTNVSNWLAGNLATALGGSFQALLLGGIGLAGTLFQDYFDDIVKPVLDDTRRVLGETVFAPLNFYVDTLKMTFTAFKDSISHLFTVTIEFNRILDEQSANFFKITQATRSYIPVIDGAVAALARHGLAISGAAEAAGVLYNTTVLFRDATTATKIDLAAYVSMLEQTGISSSSSARMIQVLNKAIGDSGGQTMKVSENIIQFARSIGVSGVQAVEGFGHAVSVLAAYGQNMTTVFRELLAQSRATGLGMQDLLGVAARFDTFEESARAVATLNSMLGGPYLNSIEMVYKTESQRNRALLESLELSGRSWHSMDRWERKAFAAASGFTDMAKALEFFSGGVLAFDRNLARAAETARKQEALMEVARRATGIWDNFKNALNALAVSFRPVLDLFRGAIVALVKWNEATGGAVAKVSLLVGAIGFLTKTFGTIGLLGALGAVIQYQDKIGSWLGRDGRRILRGFKNDVMSFARTLPDLLTTTIQLATIVMADKRISAALKRLGMTAIDALQGLFKTMSDWLGITLMKSMSFFLAHAGRALKGFMWMKRDIGKELIKASKQIDKTADDHMEKLRQQLEKTKGFKVKVGAADFPVTRRVVVQGGATPTPNVAMEAKANQAVSALGTIAAILTRMEQKAGRKGITVQDLVRGFGAIG